MFIESISRLKMAVWRRLLFWFRYIQGCQQQLGIPVKPGIMRELK